MKLATGESSAVAHKYRAIYDWMAAHPPVAVEKHGLTITTVRPQVAVRGSTVQIVAPGIQSGTVSLFTMDGAVLQSRGIESGTASLNTGAFGPGCYLLRTTDGTATQARTLTIR